MNGGPCLRLAAALIVAWGIVPATAMAAPAGAATRDDVTTAQLPGGVEGLRRALGDRIAMLPAMAVADLTRRFYNGTDVATDRDAGYARLQAWLRACETAGSAAALPADAVPLPGTPDFWRASGVDAPPERVMLGILGSRGAALLYTALLSMDPATRGWFLERPDLVRRLTESERGALVIVAPYLRLEDDRWRLPGGKHAEAVWADLVGVNAGDTRAFVVALAGVQGGLVAYLAELIATLSEDQQAAALGGAAADQAGRRMAGRALVGALRSAVESWQPGKRPFWRPSTDAAFLLSQIPVDGHGRLALPGGRKFWQQALDGVDLPYARSADEGREAETVTVFRDSDPVTASWLVARVAAAAPEDQPLVYQQVLFASRTLSGISAAAAPSALAAVRGYAMFRPLLRAMERIGVTDAQRMAAMVRQAQALTRAGDAWRARATLVQWQCAIALLERVRRGGTMTDGDAASAIDTLAAPVRQASDPAWLAWLDAVAHVGARPADIESRAIELAIVERLATVKVPGERRVQWEGTNYRVDFSAAERDRLARVRGRDARPLIDAATVLAAWSARAPNAAPADALAALTPILAAVGVDRPIDADDEFGRLARVSAVKARRQLGEGRPAASVLPAIEDLREAMATAALVEFVYAVQMGWADDLPLSAAAASRRHVFVKPFGPGRSRFWTPPAINADRQYPWHVSGSALGLDVALAPVAMRRLSLRPLGASPMVNTGDRSVLVTTAVVIDPRVFTAEALETVRRLESRARSRLDSVADADGARRAAALAGVSTLRTTLAGWLAANDRPSLDRFFSATERVRIGLEGARAPEGLGGWGNYEFALTGRVAAGALPDLPYERYAGRPRRMLAYAAPDLQITLALRLADLGFPPSLVPMLMASASLDLVNTAPARHADDWQAIVAQVQAIDQAAVERYLGLLTTAGPLRPDQRSSAP